MKRLVLPAFLILLLSLSSLSACSSKKPPTPAALQGNRTIAMLKDLSTRYEKKDLAGFMNLISSAYKDRKEFSAALQAVFAKYETVHFTVQYSKMFILVPADKGPTRATFNWDSDWHTTGGSDLKNSGRATFVFDPGDSRLASIDGKNPFIPQEIESRQKQ